MDEIRELLNVASFHDSAARECRTRAGRLLGAARANMMLPEFDVLLGSLGMDHRTAILLIEQGAGGSVRL